MFLSNVRKRRTNFHPYVTLLLLLHRGNRGAVYCAQPVCLSVSVCVCVCVCLSASISLEPLDRSA